MTAPTNTGTAVAKIDEDGIGALPAPIQQALALRKMQNLVAAKLAGMSWGQNLDMATRRAIADYGRTYNIDVTTELDILGNRPYLNSRYYLRRLAQMIEAGVVEYAVPDHIEDDPRLQAIAHDAKAPPAVRESASAECYRRMMMRVEFQVPEKAASAVVFRVKLKGMDREIVGCKWAGNGTRKGDPVGEAFPVEASESRAARRAMRQIVSHVPALAREMEDVEQAAAALEGEIARSTHEVAASIAAVSGMQDRAHHVSPSEYEGAETTEDMRLSPAQHAAAAEDGEQDDTWILAQDGELALGETRRSRTAQEEGR